MRELPDKAEKELITIRALCDVIAVTDAAGLEKNTLPALGALVEEAAERLFDYVKKGASR